MNTAAKIILGVIIGFLLVCVIGALGGMALFTTTTRALAQNLNQEPAKAEEIADSIADVEIPEGFKVEWSSELLGVTTISYRNDEPHTHLFLAQAPESFGPYKADMETILRNAVQDDEYNKKDVTKLTEVSRQELTIRGEAALLIITEGVNSDNLPFRSMTVFFQGKGGPAMLDLNAPVASWDQDTCDALIASIH